MLFTGIKSGQYTNSVDPDQTVHIHADQQLHLSCISMVYTIISIPLCRESDMIRELWSFDLKGISI